MYQDGRIVFMGAMALALSLGESHLLRDDPIVPMPKAPKKLTGSQGYFTPGPSVASKPKSSSLERMLRKGRAR